MDSFTQTQRLFELADFGFGRDAFVVTGLTGSERVSAPFHFELELLSNEPAADPEKVLGQGVALTAQLGIERKLHGVVSQFEWGELGPRQLRRYHMTLVPWFALLEHTSQCRIFQQKTAREIISTIFDQYRFGPYRYLAAPGAKREYCVQFNESDFAFVSRLLEEEGAVKLGGLTGMDEELKQIDRVLILGCGTSWHSGLIGEYMLEDIARVPTEVEYASEFRYRRPVMEPNTLALAISQSGETADTLWAMREAKQQGAMALGIVNAVGSTIARETDAGIYLHAGPEIGVASTKAFTSQVVVLAMLTAPVTLALFWVPKPTTITSSKP